MWSTTTPLGASHRGSGVSHTQTPHRRYVNGLTIFNRSIGKGGQRVGVSEHGCTWPAPVPKPSAVSALRTERSQFVGLWNQTNEQVAAHQPAGATGPRRAPRAGVHGFCPNTHCRGKILLFNCYVEISL